jgi:hypothetical protein
VLVFLCFQHSVLPLYLAASYCPTAVVLSLNAMTPHDH